MRIAFVERWFVHVAVGETGQLVVDDARQIGSGDALRASGIGDEQAGERVVEDVERLVGAQSTVDRREDRAELGEGREQLDDGEARLTPPGDAVAVTDAEVAQRVRDPVGGRVEIREGELVVVKRRGRRVRGDLRGMPQDVPNEESAGHAGSGGAARSGGSRFSSTMTVRYGVVPTLIARSVAPARRK